MAGYIIRAIETYRLPVYSNVIYLRPDAGNNDPGKFGQNLEGHNISIEYQVFRLIEMDGQEILDLKPVGLIPFTPLMKPPADMMDRLDRRVCRRTYGTGNSSKLYGTKGPRFTRKIPSRPNPQTVWRHPTGSHRYRT